MKDLASLGEVGEESGGPHPDGGLKAPHSVLPRELKGGGKGWGEVYSKQLDGICCLDPLASLPRQPGQPPTTQETGGCSEDAV